MTGRRLSVLAAAVAAGWAVGRLLGDVAVTHAELRAHAARRVPAPRVGLMPPFDQDGGR
jgi:hypothetical protein